MSGGNDHHVDEEYRVDDEYEQEHMIPRSNMKDQGPRPAYTYETVETDENFRYHQVANPGPVMYPDPDFKLAMESPNPFNEERSRVGQSKTKASQYPR